MTLIDWQKISIFFGTAFYVQHEHGIFNFVFKYSVTIRVGVGLETICRTGKSGREGEEYEYKGCL